MKMSVLVFLMLSMLSGCSFAQEKDMGLFPGHWLYKGAAGQTAAIECPDVLVFEDGGSYHVLNDCYGVDPRFPLTEKGRWAFKKDLGQISLTERVFEGNYYFLTKDSELTLIVGSLSDQKLTLSRDLSDIVYDKYERMGLTKQK